MSEPLEVVLSAPRGFCAGVVRAIEIVEICLERFGKPTYVRHEIVHNHTVVENLRQKGAVFVEDLSEVPDGSTVVFSAHGVPPEIWRDAESRGLRVIDATCPLVTKVHLESIKYSNEGYSVIVVGHEGHPEVIGTMGQAPNASQLVGTVKEAERVSVSNPEKVVALTQTTLSVEDTESVMNILRRRFPRIVGRNDICYATTNRQAAAKELAKKVELVLVIGADNSSNCNRLREVAEAMGVPAHLIDGPDKLNVDWIKGLKKIGITSGASTPETLVDAVIAKLKAYQVTNLEVTREDVVFVLPKELQAKNQKWARIRD